MVFDHGFFCRLGGNPICNKLDLNSSNPKINSNPEIGYLQQLDYRYENIALNKLVTSRRGKTKLIWILSTTLSIVFILGGVIYVVILRKYQMKSRILNEMKKEVQPTLYSYNVLKVANKKFHQDNKLLWTGYKQLGQGGFGIIYKGILLDRTKLAIKLLTTKFHQAIDDFLNEVVSITGVKHINLVKLKGCVVYMVHNAFLCTNWWRTKILQKLYGVLK
ncbi:unnamed protein product [Sphagnum tenellum]